MQAAKTGYVADFKDGYLQKEVIVNAIVTGGTDTGLRTPTSTGFAARRLVTLAKNASGILEIKAATGVAAGTIGAATHIIAQSDDTIRETPVDYNYTERYSTLPNLIVKNSNPATELKTVALFKIINVEDVLITQLS